MLEANFVLVWTINVVREINDCFHNNFKVRFKAHPSGYTNVNHKFITLVQQTIKQ